MRFRELKAHTLVHVTVVNNGVGFYDCLASHFSVVGPPGPIVATVGGIAELPCHLAPARSAETMELRWVRSSLRQVVAMYYAGPHTQELQIPEYWGRTSILTDAISEGKATLRIHQVRVSDNGHYLCYFQDGDFYEKAIVELRVAEWRKIQYMARGEKSSVYAEWKMALFQPVTVTLDPDTANPILLVSEDQRSLQRAQEQQNLPDTPERFDWHYCVLGREDFTSGRHFWEVEVGDRKDWHIGVCRWNVERKGWVKMTPENGYWTLGLCDGKDYRALTEPRTKLSLNEPPERVGVFLDYETGEVSFYNALDGSHIYTFPQTSFQGPLCPVFRILTVEPTPLRMCPPLKGLDSPLATDLIPGLSPEVLMSQVSENGLVQAQAEGTPLLLPAQSRVEVQVQSHPSEATCT
ncbi:butyrophilin subfamily 3 member A3-like [Ctenodactylus gundi]